MSLEYNKFLDWSDDKYHSLDGHISASMIKTYMKNPNLYYKTYVEKSIVSSPTPAMAFGSLVHEDFLFQRGFSDEEVKKHITATKQREIYRHVITSLRDNSVLMDLVTHRSAMVEKSILFKYKDVPCKSKIDLITHDGWIIDLKTIRSLAHEFITKSIREYRYDLQMSFYKNAASEAGIKVAGAALAFVEKNPPYESSIFYFNDEALSIGRHGNDRLRGWQPTLEEMTSPKIQVSKFDKWNEIPPLT